MVLFYQEIGYGYFYDEDGCFTDLLMNPKQVMEFKLGKGNYEYSEEREHLDNCDLVFFEIDADLYMWNYPVNNKEVFFWERERLLTV